MNNNNSLILEYHLYDTAQLIRGSKYKKFLNLSRKMTCHPFLINDTFYIQLHIQLTRRLLYCQLKVIKKYFVNFSTKQQTILEILLSCMTLCQNYQLLLNKYEHSSKEDFQPQKRISRKQKFFSEPNKLTIKQFAGIFDKLEPDFKQESWVEYQWQQLFYFIQKTLTFNYFYCKVALMKEASLFLLKLINLRPINTFESQSMYLIALGLRSTASLELGNQTNQDSIDFGLEMLQVTLKEYHKPQSNLIKLQKQLKKITSLLLINLDLQSKSQELNDNHSQCIQSLNLANFFGQLILKPLNARTELYEYIQSEYEFANEKFEQIILEEQDLTKFTQFLYKIPENDKTTTKIIASGKLQEMIKAKIQNQSFQKGFQKIKSNEQFLVTTNSSEKLTLAQYLPIKIKSYHQRESSIASNPYGNSTINQTAAPNNITKESPSFASFKRERINGNSQIKSFISNSNKTPSSRSLQQRTPKRPQSVKPKKITLNSEHKSSYLSQLIKLGQRQGLAIKDEMSELEKNYRSLVEQLNNSQKQFKVTSIDQFFNKKIEAIAFEECMTLDQIKDTAKKIITTEWEIHKEMPVTQSLMKSISVSDIQLEQQQAAFNKVLEYLKIQNFDYYNTEKDRAKETMQHTKEVKKLKFNQHKYSMRHRYSQSNILNTQQIQNLVMPEAKVQEKLNSQLLSQQNSVEVKVSPRIARKNASLIYTTNLESESKETRFKQIKGQLIDLMIKNLEYRDELNTQEQQLKQFVLPRQFRTTAISPQGAEFSLKTQNVSDFKSFAFSTNSTQITQQNILHQKV